MISEIIECKNKSGNRADGAHMLYYIFGKTKEHLLISDKEYIFKIFIYKQTNKKETVRVWN